MKIMILGAGTFGCALANTLIDAGCEVICWSHSKNSIIKLDNTRTNENLKDIVLNEKIIFTDQISDVNKVDCLVFAIPSFAIRETSKKINNVLNNDVICVIATKGLEEKSMDSCYDIIQSEISNIKDIVIFSGPSHAEELGKKMLTAMVATSNNIECAKVIQKEFTTNYLRIYTQNDVRGVEILGAAKNVLAIAAGFCDGNRNLGDNAKAALLTRGLRELKVIGHFEKCQDSTFYGLTGLGDLIVTANSKHSRNRLFGEFLGKGLNSEDAQKSIGMVIEGVHSVKAIHQLKLKYKLDLPLIETIYKCIYEDIDVEKELINLFQRPLKSE